MQRTGTFNGKRFVIFILIPLLILVLTLSLDIVTKYFADKDKVNKTVIENFFYLSYSLNPGAAFSFLANKDWGQTFFKIITSIALIAFVYFYVFAVKKGYKWLTVSLTFIISGTIGNFIDRLSRGEVVDFLSFKFGSYFFPTFNVADVCLTVGVIMLIVHFCFFDKNALFIRKKKDIDKEEIFAKENKTKNNNERD